MDHHTLENWRKIKHALEAAGKTDNHYYKRAVAICGGLSDPFDQYNLYGQGQLHGRPSKSG